MQMNILETLIQLRDDIKTWVTNNLVALDNKIESKTIPIDNELKTDSTNPVQNKTIAKKIDEINTTLTALDTLIEDIQSGVANIVDDGSGEFNITDPSGNVVFKVDEHGTHTISINIEGEETNTFIDAHSIATSEIIADKIEVNGADLSDTYAEKNHGNHVPNLESATVNRFLRNDNTWQDVTPENIGALASIKAVSGSNINNVGTPSVTATTNGTETTLIFNYLKGNKGDKGDQGIQGIQGIQGVQGVQGEKGDGFSISKLYASVADMQAGYTTDNVPIGGFVLINTNNVEDADNAKLYVKTSTAYSYLTDLSGSQGIRGEKGEQGIQGIQGEQGIQGDKGDKGDQGEQGLQGPQGDKGEQGVGILSIIKTASDGLLDTYTITYSDGNESTFTVMNGANGEQGPQGEKGNKGDKGDKGDQGEAGEDGLTPSIGENGNWWIGDVDTGVKAEGTQGDKGDKGDTGEQGPKGEDGKSISVMATSDACVEIGQGYIDPETGHLMILQSTAPRVFTDAGEVKGPKGDKGESGAAGVGIESITLVATNGLKDTYRITFSDGSTKYYDVTNGADGEKGDKGEQGEKGDKGEKGDPGEKGPQGDKGDPGITPTIAAKAGSNINSVGAPTVTASTEGTVTTFTFNNLKGDKGDPGVNATTTATATAAADGLLSSSDKAKLDTIQQDANKNVQADWNETDPNSDAYIQHKLNITDDESDNLVCVDEAGNIIAKVDAAGIKTTRVDAKQVLVNGKEIIGYVDTKVANLVNSAPEKLNTLDELAAALGDDANFATTVTNALAEKAKQSDLIEHISKTENPHNVTKDQIGLASVDNTSDADKPVSIAQQEALDNLKSELSESIVSEAAEFIVVDELGNKILDVDESGLTTTTVKANQIIVDGTDLAEQVNGKLSTSGGIVKGTLSVQNGSGTGAIIIGGDTNATTLTQGTRHIGRIALPLTEDISKTMLILAADTSGDVTSTIGATGTNNRIEFGGRLGATGATAPDSIAFTVAKTHNATETANKVYAMEMNASQARFNVPISVSTVKAPANIDQQEQITTKFMTPNGGSVSFGKEGKNSGTMMRLDQADGTCRLRFRGSTTTGAMVWEQPEQGANLYVDLGKDGVDKHRIQFPASAGTLALNTVASTTTNGLMSKTDKAKLDSIDVDKANANVNHTHSYEDLDNAPAITQEDADQELCIVDPEGNIAMKVDANGLRVGALRIGNTVLTEDQLKKLIKLLDA